MWIRRLLQPLLKLFFNPNPLIHVLHMQSQINDLNASRHQLYYELIHNLVVETTRLGIEVKNLRMRVESLDARVDFSERRARALEGAVIVPAASRRRARGAPVPAGPNRAARAESGPRTVSPAPAAQVSSSGSPGPGGPGPGPAPAPGAESSGQRSKRRRRRRGRRGGAPAASVMGSPGGLAAGRRAPGAPRRARATPRRRRTPDSEGDDRLGFRSFDKLRARRGRRRAVKLAVVVQRYGQAINGGAELHARYIAEHLARHAEVDVLTTHAQRLRHLA